MSLAHTVYNLSMDNEFASQFNLDPETALVEKGLQLGREEMAFLSSGMNNARSRDEDSMGLSEIALIQRGWK